MNGLILEETMFCCLRKSGLMDVICSSIRLTDVANAEGGFEVATLSVAPASRSVVDALQRQAVRVR